MAGNTSDPGASVASRLLTVLGAFDDEHRAMTLSQIARRAGLPLPTTHRLVAELATWGGLVRRPTGEYVVGRRIWELALLAPTQTGLRQIAEPFLHDVYGATLATVHLAVREGAEVLYRPAVRHGVRPDRQHRRLPTAAALHGGWEGAARARARRRARRDARLVDPDDAVHGDPARSCASSWLGCGAMGMRQRSRRCPSGRARWPSPCFETPRSSHPWVLWFPA